MTYLEIVQRLAREAGYGSTIATTQNLTGIGQKFALWAQDAWIDIQNKRNDWLFMKSEASLSFPAGVRTFAIGDDLGISNLKAFYGDTIYASDSGGYYQIRLIPHYKFRQITLGRDLYTRRPTYAAIAPGYSLALDSFPEKAVTATADYVMTAQKLTANEDEPNFNEDWHMAIVWDALRKYGESEADPDVVARAKREFGSIYTRLVNNETPDIEFGPDPLATGRSWYRA